MDGSLNLKDYPLLVGWREWCTLPELGIPAIKIKIDTGARTSALHAFNINSFYRRGKKFVSFSVHPLQANNQILIKCESLVIEERSIMSSNGHREHRYVILTPISLGDQMWNIELSLSNRDPLKFRMLLGREAMKSCTTIDPNRSFFLGKIKKRQLEKIYQI